MPQHVKVSNRCKVKDLEEPCPLAHAMHCMTGQILDDGKQERKQYARWAQRLWIGDYGTGMTLSCANKQSHDSKITLERLLKKASSTRREYKKHVCWHWKLDDLDFARSLDPNEANMLRDAWMDDVATWMSPKLHKEYKSMVRQVKKKGNKSNRVGKPNAQTPQRVRAFTKHSFEHMLKSLSTSEAFFMVSVRPPLLHTLDRVLMIIHALSEVQAPMYVNSMGTAQ